MRDMLIDRRSAPAIKVHTRRGPVDILHCGHGVDVEEVGRKVRRSRETGELRRVGVRLLRGQEYRRCEKCARGAPVEFIIPTEGY